MKKRKEKNHFQIVFSTGHKNKSQRDSEGRRPHTEDRLTGPQGRKETHVWFQCPHLKETSLSQLPTPDLGVFSSTK